MTKYIILGILAILIIAGYFMFFNTETIWPKEKIINSVAKVNTSGSGYRDLEGTFIDYKYADFGGFRLAFYDNQIMWQGYGGYFNDVTAKVSPQVSKVDKDVYFLSWVFPFGGGDNVVVNFETNKVFAHLHQVGADRSIPFELIHGTIICGPSKDCNFPKGSLSSMLQITKIIESNTKEFNLPKMGTMERPLIAEHNAARKELAGKVISYETDEGTIAVQVDGDITYVTDNGVQKKYQTHTTKISEGIYFISWLLPEDIGQHIVFNQKTMQVFDQITPEGVSLELIYKAKIVN